MSTAVFLPQNVGLPSPGDVIRYRRHDGIDHHAEVVEREWIAAMDSTQEARLVLIVKNAQSRSGMCDVRVC